MAFLTVPVASGNTRTYRVLKSKSGLAVLDCEDHYSVTHIASGRILGQSIFVDRALALKAFQEFCDLPVDWELELEELTTSSWFLRRMCPEILQIVSDIASRDAEQHPDRYEDEHAEL